uniref:C2H2-type domain-containing protein n=1 Tax=Macrostomum lignano TaxID=282301 RepID=A0A1I8F5U9_9PLAT
GLGQPVCQLCGHCSRSRRQLARHYEAPTGTLRSATFPAASATAGPPPSPRPSGTQRNCHSGGGTDSSGISQQLKPPQQFACDHCGRRFAKRSRLRDHLAASSVCRSGVGSSAGNLPVSQQPACQGCGRRFSRRDKLAAHLRLGRCKGSKGVGDLPGRPKKPRCVPQVPSTDFERFIYKCRDCSLGFKRPGPNNLPCPLCGSLFRSDQQRQAHLQRVHGVASPPTCTCRRHAASPQWLLPRWSRTRIPHRDPQPPHPRQSWVVSTAPSVISMAHCCPHCPRHSCWSTLPASQCFSTPPSPPAPPRPYLEDDASAIVDELTARAAAGESAGCHQPAADETDWLEGAIREAGSDRPAAAGPHSLWPSRTFTLAVLGCLPASLCPVVQCLAHWEAPLVDQHCTGQFPVPLLTARGLQYFDLTDVNKCNWLVFLQPQKTCSSQRRHNLLAHQRGSQLYFRCTQSVPAGEGAALRVEPLDGPGWRGVASAGVEWLVDALPGQRLGGRHRWLL